MFWRRDKPQTLYVCELYRRLYKHSRTRRPYYRTPSKPMNQPYHHISHGLPGHARRSSPVPANGGLFATDPERWLERKRKRLTAKVPSRWEREKRRTAAARGYPTMFGLDDLIHVRVARDGTLRLDI